MEEQELTEKKIADVDSGNRVKPRLVSILKKNHLKNILIDYDQYGALEYLYNIRYRERQISMSLEQILEE